MNNQSIAQNIATTLNNRKVIAMTLGVVSTLTMASTATAAQIKVSVDSLVPQDGLVISRLWFGFHDGNFQTFNFNAPAPEYLERLAEDATIEPTGQFQNTLTTAFANSGAGISQGIVPGSTGPFSDFFSGDKGSVTLNLDGSLPTSQYFSYAAMGLPSNDAFIANEDARAFQIFDDAGNFKGGDFIVTGNQVWDAGTEVNDEIPTNTALLAQAAPNTGVDENGVVVQHPGFQQGGNILSSFANANFTTPGYQVVRIKIEQVPESSNLVGISVVAGLLWFGRCLRRQFSIN